MSWGYIINNKTSSVGVLFSRGLCNGRRDRRPCSCRVFHYSVCTSIWGCARTRGECLSRTSTQMHLAVHVHGDAAVVVYEWLRACVLARRGWSAHTETAVQGLSSQHFGHDPGRLCNDRIMSSLKTNICLCYFAVARIHPHPGAVLALARLTGST